MPHFANATTPSKRTEDALWLFLDNQRKAGTVDGEWYDGRRPDVGCPQDYIDVLIAERFGGWPWSLKDAPADDYYRFMRIMGLEGEIKAALMGLEPDEDFIREDE